MVTNAQKLQAEQTDAEKKFEESRQLQIKLWCTKNPNQEKPTKKPETLSRMKMTRCEGKITAKTLPKAEDAAAILKSKGVKRKSSVNA